MRFHDDHDALCQADREYRAKQKRKYESQNRRLLRELLVAENGLTSMEIIRKIGTVNPTRNISELRAQGHQIESVDSLRGGRVLKAFQLVR